MSKSGANPRMLYHYYGSKLNLYVSVLETALGGLRAQELWLDVEHLDPLEGLLQLFDFMNGHFEANRHLVSLLTTENLLKAQHMRRSSKIRDMSSPVLEIISRFLNVGTKNGRLRQDLDPLRLHVLMVALSQFHVSNVHTLSVIFDQDLTHEDWRADRKTDARCMLRSYLTAPPVLRGRSAREVD